MRWDRSDPRRWRLRVPGRIEARALVSLHAGSVGAGLWLDGHLVYSEWGPSAGGMEAAAEEIDGILRGFAEAVRRQDDGR